MPAARRPTRALNIASHGLGADAVIRGIESETEAEAAREAWLADLEPVGHVERMLAERIALTHWRLQRVHRYERDAVEFLRARMEAGGRSLPSYASADGEVDGGAIGNFYDAAPRTRLPRLDDCYPQDDVIDRVVRYEAHLDRVFYRAYHELEVRQSRRLGRPIQIARVEVHGVPAG